MIAPLGNARAGRRRPQVRRFPGTRPRIWPVKQAQPGQHSVRISLQCRRLFQTHEQVQHFVAAPNPVSVGLLSGPDYEVVHVIQIPVTRGQMHAVVSVVRLGLIASTRLLLLSGPLRLPPSAWPLASRWSTMLEDVDGLWGWCGATA